MREWPQRKSTNNGGGGEAEGRDELILVAATEAEPVGQIPAMAGGAGAGARAQRTDEEMIITSEQRDLQANRY